MHNDVLILQKARGHGKKWIGKYLLFATHLVFWYRSLARDTVKFTNYWVTKKKCTSLRINIMEHVIGLYKYGFLVDYL